MPACDMSRRRWQLWCVPQEDADAAASYEAALREQRLKLKVGTWQQQGEGPVECPFRAAAMLPWHSWGQHLHASRGMHVVVVVVATVVLREHLFGPRCRRRRCVRPRWRW